MRAGARESCANSGVKSEGKHPHPEEVEVMGLPLGAWRAGVAVEIGCSWSIWVFSSQQFPAPVLINLHMDTYKKASEGPWVPDLSPDPHLTPPSFLEAAAREVSIFTHPVLRELCECPWERILFNFLFSSGISNSFKGGFS